MGKKRDRESTMLQTSQKRNLEKVKGKIEEKKENLLLGKVLWQGTRQGGPLSILREKLKARGAAYKPSVQVESSKKKT